MSPKAEPIVFGQPLIGEAEIAEVVDSLRHCWIGTGPKVARFEEAFARYKGASSAVAIGSCSAGLELALRAYDVGAGDEVITTAMTFCATLNAIIHTGATPVIVDVDEGVGNLSLESVDAAVTDRTRAIIPVHLAGYPVDMVGLKAIAQKHGLLIIEDCAHAIETTRDGVGAGLSGHVGVFSFYATKNLTTAEGGMVISSDTDVLDRVKRLANHGLSADAWSRFSDVGYRHYVAEEVGYKYNMTDIQAALGIHQLERLEANHERREQIWRTYDAAFAGLPMLLPALPEDVPGRHALHLYRIEVGEGPWGDRDEVMRVLWEGGVGTGVHYLAIPEHPVYRRLFGWEPEAWPRALRMGRRTLSLPLGPGMSDEQVERVVAAVRSIFRA